MPVVDEVFLQSTGKIILRLRRAEWFSPSSPAAGLGRTIFSAFLFGALHLGSLDQQVAAAAAAAATDRVRGRSRLALGRCHVRQAADAGSGVGQLLEYEVRFSQVLARRQRRQRRRQRRLRWRRERRLPSWSARPRDITGDQKIECWLNVLGLGIPREMRDLSCSKPKNFPACRRLSEVRVRSADT